MRRSTVEDNRNRFRNRVRVAGAPRPSSPRHVPDRLVVDTGRAGLRGHAVDHLAGQRSAAVRTLIVDTRTTTMALLAEAAPTFSRGAARVAPCREPRVGAAHRPGSASNRHYPARQASRRSRCLSIFMLASFGSSSRHAYERRSPLRAQVGLSVQESVERNRVEGNVCGELEGRHHPVPDWVVGHRVHGDRPDTREAADDGLDRRGGEVLAVDSEPFVRASGEVQPPVGVAVSEIPRPVPAARGSGYSWRPRSCNTPRSRSWAASQRSRRPPRRG